MRLYLYIDKDLVKRLAANISNIHFDIDFFEYSEKRGYTIRNDTTIRPDIDKKKDEKDNCKLSVGLSQEVGSLSSLEVFRRYINIEDVASIKNNSFYYTIINLLKEDNRLKRISGKITDIKEDFLIIEDNKFILDFEAQNELKKLFKYETYLTLLGYKINDLKSKYDVFKTIAIYIE